MSHAKVIPAKDSSNLNPGCNVDRAKLFGVSVAFCGESCECCPDRQGWEGYIYSHPVLGESKDAYESAEDCADAALLLLAKELAFEFDSAVVKRDDLREFHDAIELGVGTSRCGIRCVELIEESLNPLKTQEDARS